MRKIGCVGTTGARYLLNAAFGAVLLVALGTVHMRVQTTLIGYELGKLKNTEAERLQERSALQMQLAQLTSRHHLSMLVSAQDQKSAPRGQFASN